MRLIMRSVASVCRRVTLVWSFCSCDLDLDPMTRIYELTLIFWRFTYTQMKFPRQDFYKLVHKKDRQTHRETRLNASSVALAGGTSWTRSSSTAEITRDAWNGHWRSLKVIRCCANRRGIYDFLLALNSNLTSIFNRSWDITPSLYTHTPPLFQMELEKDDWEYRWTCFGVRVPRTLDYPTVNLNPR